MAVEGERECVAGFRETRLANVYGEKKQCGHVRQESMVSGKHRTLTSAYERTRLSNVVYTASPLLLRPQSPLISSAGHWKSKCFSLTGPNDV